MGLGTAVFTVVTLVSRRGADVPNEMAHNRSADAHEARADEKQRHATGRGHARVALDIARKASTEFVGRRSDEGSRDINVDDLKLDDANRGPAAEGNRSSLTIDSWVLGFGARTALGRLYCLIWDGGYLALLALFRESSRQADAPARG